MPDENKIFGGSLVLDFRKWWRQVETIYYGCGVESPVWSAVAPKLRNRRSELGNSRRRSNFGDDIWTFKSQCCQGQLSFPVVTIQQQRVAYNISRALLLWRQRPTSCHWKRSQLSVTTTQVSLKTGHHGQTFVAPYSTENRSSSIAI